MLICENDDQISINDAFRRLVANLFRKENFNAYSDDTNKTTRDHRLIRLESRGSNPVPATKLFQAI
jgi:hypothetical protein